MTALADALATLTEQAKHYPTVAGENMRLREERATQAARIEELTRENARLNDILYSRPTGNAAMREHTRTKRMEAAEARATALEEQINAALNEAYCCDDIPLNQPLAGIISDLQKDREYLRAALNQGGK